MLESMTRSPLPTRAEVNDVANAVLDGTDALMLSEETAVGLFPGETVRMMSEVAESAEGWPRDRVDPATSVGADADRVAWAVAHAAVQAAEDLGVAAILCPTRSGQTAHRVAAFRPRVPIAAISPSPQVLGGLCLVWGVRPTGSPRKPQRRGTDTARDRGRTGGGHRPRRRSGGARFRLGRTARRQHRQRTHRARLIIDLATQPF
jgi:pyruvate kinase